MGQRSVRWRAFAGWRAVLALSWSLAAMQALAALPPEVETALQRARVPQDAVAIVLQEAGSGRTLLSHNAQAPVNPASLAKLLTTLAGPAGAAWT